MPKLTRRILLIVMVFCLAISCKNNNRRADYYSRINTLLGIKGKGFGERQRYLEAGNAFPGPMLPFGMVQYTPTFFDPNRGVVISQMGGVGCRNKGTLPMLLFPGSLEVSPNDMMAVTPEMQIEEAQTGYYKTNLFGSASYELTATNRTGFARINFNATDNGSIIIATGINSTEISEAEVKIIGSNFFEEISDGGNFCGTNSKCKIYFAGEFDSNAETSGIWMEDSLVPKETYAKDQNSGAYFTFNNEEQSEALYKVGISYVSVENAKQNLRTEKPCWDFVSIKKKAENEWNDVLAIINVGGGSEDKTIEFYSHLYHGFAQPSVFNDVNGEYIGADFENHTIEDDNYTAFSNWNTYRTRIPLLNLLVPEKSSELESSLLSFPEQSGGGLPRWICANFEIGIMQDHPSSALVANAYAFGAKDFDTSEALKTMRRGVEIPSEWGTQQSPPNFTN